MSNCTFICCDREKLDIHSIIWLKGDWNYTWIYQQGQPGRLSTHTLKWYERNLTGFIRVSKGAMVNPVHVQGLQSISSRPRRLRIVLSTGEELEVARRRQPYVRRQLGPKSYKNLPDAATNPERMSLNPFTNI